MSRQQKSRRKTENAFKAVLDVFGSTNLKALAQFLGYDLSKELSTPRLQIVADTSKPEMIGGNITGNNVVTLRLSVIHHKNDTTRDQHGDLTADLEDLVFRVDIVDLMNGLAPWTPANGTPTIWLDAADEPTITAVAGAVSQWDDKSGNNIDALNTSTSPTTGTEFVNNLNAIDFKNDFMTANSIPISSGNLSFLAVVEINTVDNAQDSVFAISGGSGLNFEFQAQNAGQFDGFVNHFGDASDITITGGPYSGLHLFGLTYNFGTGIIDAYIDGNLVGSVSDYLTSLPTTTALRIMSELSTVQRLDGFVGEVMLFPQVDQATRELFEGYAAWKWGAEFNLPASHTYKDARPSVSIPNFPDNYSLQESRGGVGRSSFMIVECTDTPTGSEVWSSIECELKVLMKGL